MSGGVMFHVQHLLGTGHQHRSAAIARALADTGVQVDYVSGGFPLAHLTLGRARLHQLAPARVRDGRFQQLEDEHGQPVDSTWCDARRDALLALEAALEPALVVTETFPFGRGLLRFELLPLLEQVRARARCRLICSVRDIIEPRDDPKARQRMLTLVRDFYSDVLVHGDPTLMSFARTFPEADAIADRLHYTGYVTTTTPPSPAERCAGGPVLVSCGGGRVGEQLVSLALAARVDGALDTTPWRLRVGAEMPACSVARLRDAAPPGVQIEAATEGFVEALADASVSVSQAGYNTVAELLATGTPAVLIPYAHEREQGLRAAAMARHGLAQVVSADDASPASLARAMTAALGAGRMRHDIDLAGVSRSVHRIRQWLE